MSEIVGTDLNPTEETSLASMISLGLAKHLEKYDLSCFIRAGIIGLA